MVVAKKKEEEPEPYELSGSSVDLCRRAEGGELGGESGELDVAIYGEDFGVAAERIWELVVVQEGLVRVGLVVKRESEGKRVFNVI
ncbi:unnamed protein product [Prunus armeniaca]|uniref:Uncharacterized protein n=1 Tax=Prunus armeniaca TaxID=36596 RepID=A0A6J5WUZ7_PRUAR|nr:unnamed protein product [Prunus armeniaca]